MVDSGRACPNLRVRMTGLATGSGLVAPDAGPTANGACELEATSDPWDRAHRQYGVGPAAELLVSGKVAIMARPREYHRSYMVGPRGARVSFETMAERTAARAARLGLDRGPTMAQVVQQSLGRLAALDKRGEAARTVVEGQPVRERYAARNLEDQREKLEADRHERQVAALLAASAAPRGVRA